MKIFFLILFIFSVSCFPGDIFSQTNNTIWYFGNLAGLDFNGGAPVAVSNSQLSTAEGSASITDINGALLFYSDGVTVWNKKHQVMVNGTMLRGGGSTTQSCLIEQLPGSADIYYIFTIEDQNTSGTFTYSVVDMSLQGGDGKVTIKNVVITANIAEKISAIKDASNTNTWVMVHERGTNILKAYSLSASGISSSSVNSSVGNAIIVNDDNVGQMKFSPDKTKLAAAYRNTNIIDLFDFDAVSGLVSNVKQLTLPTVFYGVYGIEFSPCSGLLYGTTISTSGIYQWDVTLSTEAAVKASRIQIGIPSATNIGSMQLAPDGKIYIAKYNSTFLAAINKPNLAGSACNFVDNAVSIGASAVIQLGLPNYVQSSQGQSSIAGTVSGTSPLCTGQTAVYASTGSAGGTWSSSNAGVATINAVTGLVTAISAGTANIVYSVNSGCGSPGIASRSISVNAAAFSGIVSGSPSTICKTGTTTYTSDGTAGGMWSSSDNTIATVDVNTGTITGVSGGTVNILYTIAGCNSPAPASKVLTVNPAAIGQWIGITSDWNDIQNWCSGLLPTATIDVMIPVTGLPFYYPVVSTATAITHNIIITTGASLSVTGETLEVAGIITNNGILNASNGTIEMIGTAPQTIGAGTFQNNDLKNLIISNTNAAGVTVGGPLNIYGKLSFGNGNNKLLNSSGFINLRSTPVGTAMVTDVTNDNPANNNNRITGDVIVERYYPGRRAWRLVTAPVSTPRTIFNEWQIGGVPATLAPGSGTDITKPFGTGFSGDGMDSSRNYSMKRFNQATGLLEDVMNTKVPISGNARILNVPDNLSYFLFVRGDRSPGLLFAYPITNYNITTLRDTGVLQTGKKTFGPVAANDFMLVGNPYASPIDFGSLIRTNISRKFWAWDPRLNTTLGSYVLVDGRTPGVPYIIIPAPDPIIETTGQDSIIQSSQAFFVQADAAGSGTVQFNENSKTTKDNNTVFRPARKANAFDNYENLRINLYLNEPDTAILEDGVYLQFNQSFSSDIDDLDGLKFINFLENLGMTSHAKTLTLERRPLITGNDTIFFKLWKTTEKNYQFRFSSNSLNHPGLDGYLEDNYLKTKTPVDLNGYTNINFSITSDAASKASDRFMMVFESAAGGPLPVTFTLVKAYWQNSNINVEWNVNNEINIKAYDVQRSSDGREFTAIGSVIVTGNNGSSSSYQWPDLNPEAGTYYYRIRRTGHNGEVRYSNIVKVIVGKEIPSITVYPNPVEGSSISLHLTNQPKGRYDIRLINKLGQLIMIKQIEHEEGSSTETLPLSKTLAHGTYQLEITKPDYTKKMINFLY